MFKFEHIKIAIVLFFSSTHKDNKEEEKERKKRNFTMYFVPKI